MVPNPCRKAGWYESAAPYHQIKVAANLEAKLLAGYNVKSALPLLKSNCEGMYPTMFVYIVIVIGALASGVYLKHKANEPEDNS